MAAALGTSTILSGQEEIPAPLQFFKGIPCNTYEDFGISLE
ncbi:predicted protein [Plenodomus lingam JN3]|uniref:Uncharacterized protein n=1 Tax=Leptosphaeria maculans (strain JN3 / isolate v23.1.3 / race Av1-4-5-6-7-8) TaxID=985895 RepID=E5A602_LEPMJ|nr:predicted protein [Plenodomus lingam JN3]CBX99047.1 predicted protein [Plenodomus lingam JN3]